MARPDKKKRIVGCIFCGEKNLTEEHIWPRWVEKEKLFPYARHDSTFGFWDVTLGRAQKRLHRRTIKCTCISCNNGWISRLVEDAKPVTKSLALGLPLLLSIDHQKRLAAQAALMTIIAEWYRPETTSVTRTQRLALKHNIENGSAEPSKGFYIWIGARSFAPEYPTDRDHKPWVFVAGNDYSNHDKMPMSAQLNILTFGCYVMFVLCYERLASLNFDVAAEFDRLIGPPRFPLLRIWPIVKTAHWWTTGRLIERQHEIAIRNLVNERLPMMMLTGR